MLVNFSVFLANFNADRIPMTSESPLVMHQTAWANMSFITEAEYADISGDIKCKCVNALPLNKLHLNFKFAFLFSR